MASDLFFHANSIISYLFFFPSLLFLDAMIYVDLKKIGYDIRKIDGEINEINIFFLLKEKTEFTYYEKKSNMR